MLNSAMTAESSRNAKPQAAAVVVVHGDDANRHAGQSIADMLSLLNELFTPQRRMVHAGDLIYQSGERFGHLYVLNSGFFKVVNLAPDGRELGRIDVPERPLQVVSGRRNLSILTNVALYSVDLARVPEDAGRTTQLRRHERRQSKRALR